MKILYITLLTLITIGSYSQNNYRNVYWVHGYKGSDQAFEKVGNDVGGISGNGYATGRFQVNSKLINYSGSESSMDNATHAAQRQMLQIALNRTNTNKDFVIAHSQGGLVTRNMEVPTMSGSRKLYNGFITFGTAHKGAHAANTLVYETYKVHNFLNETCQLFGTALAEDAASNSLIGSIATAAGLVGMGVKYTCNGASKTIFPAATNLMMVGIENDLTTNYAPNIPQMATRHNAVFYGVENDNGTLAARFAGSFSIKPPNEYELYKADASDQEGINFFREKEDFIRNRYLHWKNMSIPFLYFLKKKKRKRLVQSYNNALNWFSTYNDTWKELIGAKQSSLVKVGCVCEYEDYYGNLGTIFRGNANTNCSSLEGSLNYPVDRCTDRYRTVTLSDKPSDGFILEESARGANNLHYPPQIMEGSNHMQMKNDDNMRIAVDKIFNGKLKNGRKDINDFFYTRGR